MNKHKETDFSPAADNMHAILQWVHKWKDHIEVIGVVFAAIISLVALGQSCNANRIAKQSVDLQKSERVETKVSQWYDAEMRFANDMTDYGRLVHTFALVEHGIDLNATNVIPDQAIVTAVYEKVGDAGIYERIVTDVDQLRDLGFDLFLKQRAPKVYDSLVLFRLKLDEPTSVNQHALRGALIGTLLHNSGAGKTVAAISKEEIRSFLQSP